MLLSSSWHLSIPVVESVNVGLIFNRPCWHIFTSVPATGSTSFCVVLVSSPICSVVEYYAILNVAVLGNMVWHMNRLFVIVHCCWHKNCPGALRFLPFFETMWILCLQHVGMLSGYAERQSRFIVHGSVVCMFVSMLLSKCGVSICISVHIAFW